MDRVRVSKGDGIPIMSDVTPGEFGNLIPEGYKGKELDFQATTEPERSANPLVNGQLQSRSGGHARVGMMGIPSRERIVPLAVASAI